MLRFCRLLTAFLACLLLVTLLGAVPVFAQETEDSQIFLSGFNAYQQKKYPVAVARLSEVLKKYPETPLRDMTLFWLARSHYKAGNLQDAGRYMAQFSREYPDNPLKNTVEEELLTLAGLHERSQTAALQQDEVAKQRAVAEAEQEKLAALKREEERLVRERAEAEKLAALQAAEETERLAQEKAAEERRAAAKREEERIAKEKLEAERQIALKVEEERLAREKADREASEKVLALKAKADAWRMAREKAEAEQLAAKKADEERLARERAESERIAVVKKAEEQRQAALEAERQKLAAQKVEEERRAKEQAEVERLAAVKKAEEQRQAALEAERQKLADQKAEEERLAREKAEAERVAVVKAAEEKRLAAEKAAAAMAEQKERELTIARKAEAEQRAAEKARQDKDVLKEKAIVEYKGILSRFPGTRASQVAAARLKELGVAVALPAAVSSAPAAAETAVGAAHVLTLEVAQYAAFEFDVQSPTRPVDVAQKTVIPFEVQNRGNGNDSFYLASGFPAEFGARFVAASDPEQAINQTPMLASEERFKGLLLVSLPPSSIDGLRFAYPVKAASQLAGEASRSRVVMLAAAAPLLRAVVKTDNLQVLPGEKVQYRIAVLNVGSTTARDVTLRVNFPAQYQPVEYSAAGFRQEMNAALVLDGLTLNPGESRDLTATFQLKDESLAKEELVVRADLLNNVLQTRATFLSNATLVLPFSAVVVRMADERIIAIPGETVTIPARVINKGNYRERFKLAVPSTPFKNVVICNDLNRDGVRQAGEPEVTVVGPLGPNEEMALLLEVTTPQSAQDGTHEKLTLTATPESGHGKIVTAESLLGYSRPVVQLTMKGREGRMVPGELLNVELNVRNQGSNLAKLVELDVRWPDQVELVTADTAACRSQSGGSSWCFSELGAGEKRVVKASFRIKSGTGVGTGVQLKSVLSYQDHVGNRY